MSENLYVSWKGQLMIARSILYLLFVFDVKENPPVLTIKRRKKLDQSYKVQQQRNLQKTAKSKTCGQKNR
jgi:ATP-dependent RNA circularization protein (DNA/RNA ligase family)